MNFQNIVLKLIDKKRRRNEYNKAVIEEVSGALSSHVLISGISASSFGAVMLLDPLIATIIITLTLILGTIIKVKSGIMFDNKRFKYKDIVPVFLRQKYKFKYFLKRKNKIGPQ